jgi:hypothetical protein
MPLFRVTEEIVYELEAESEEAAIEAVVETPDRDRWVFVVTERYAELLKSTPTEGK